MSNLLQKLVPGKSAERLERRLCRHPVAAFFLLSIVMPTLILLTVTALSSLIILPISLLCGWL